MTFEKKDQILISGVFKEYCDEATMSGQRINQHVVAHKKQTKEPSSNRYDVTSASASTAGFW
jgi:hypothetical protein